MDECFCRLFVIHINVYFFFPVNSMSSRRSCDGGITVIYSLHNPICCKSFSYRCYCHQFGMHVFYRIQCYSYTTFMCYKKICFFVFIFIHFCLFFIIFFFFVPCVHIILKWKGLCLLYTVKTTFLFNQRALSKYHKKISIEL